MIRSFDLEKESLEEDNPLSISSNLLHWLYEVPFTQHYTPCQVVFGRDVIHNIVFKANGDTIQKGKQVIINKSNKKEKKGQIPYEYYVGDQVLLETLGTLWKLSTSRTGPY
jgi:hypothetical protein